jgi:intergrase/recombinase
LPLYWWLLLLQLLSWITPNDTSFNISTDEFHNWLASQGKTRATIKETVNYAKRFASVLDTGDASELLTLSPRNKHHALTSLANLAKYTGRYDQFLQMRQRYNLKWSKGDSIQHFHRFFSEELSFDIMLQRIKEMITKTPSWVGKILRFAILVGLRPSEVVESVRLLNGEISFETSPRYYNPERQALEHFRFPQFLRQTKKAFISFVTPEMLKEIVQDSALSSKITYNAIRLACWSAGIKCDMRFARKIFASHLRASGIQPEIIDLLQGRVSQSILTRHYLVPKPSFKEDVLNALQELQNQLQ